MAIIDDITNLYVGYFNRAPDPAGLNFWVAQRNAGASLAGIAQSFSLTPEAQSLYSYLAAPLVGSAASFLTSVYANLFNRVANATTDAAGFAYWTAQLAGTRPVGLVIVDIISGATGNDALVVANKSAVGKAFVTKLVDTNAIFNLAAAKNAFVGVTSDVATVATVTAVNDSVIIGSNVTNASQLFRLSEGIDIKTGGATNDTFDGSRVTTPAGQLQTLNNGDFLDGGAGSDTVFAQLTANATPAGFKNIEVLDVEAQAGITVDINTGDTALTTIKSSNSGANLLTVINVQSAPTNYVISNGSGGLTVSVVGARLAGATDAATIDLNTVTGAAPIILGNTGASGYETITINSNGTVANVLGNFGDGAATSLSTVNIAGAQALTVVLTDTSVATVNAATFTGALTQLTVAALSGAQTITGGTGNDLINMNGTYTALDVLNGGAGTDSLILTNAEAAAAVTVQAGVTNFEVVRLSTGLSGTVTPGNFGVTNLRFGANMAAAGTVNYAAVTGNVLDLQTFNDGGFALVTNTAGTATNDVLGLTVGSTTAGNTFGAGGVTINGAEVVNLLSQGGANTFGGVFTITDTAATQSLIITGTQSLTITGAVRADTIDASGTTGPLAALVLTGGTGTTATSITGTANADTLNGSTAGDIINGGAGNDAIANVVTGTAAAAGDQIAGGAGFDTITLRGSLASEAVATAYGKAAFVTEFTVGATAASTDILQLSATAANYTGSSAFFAGVAAAAAGATTIQTVAQNAAAAAIVAGVDLIKLTTGVATTGLTVQTAFNAAIGTGTVTGLTASDDIFVSFYDTTNSRAVILHVDAGSAGTNTIVETADAVTLVGTIAMSATDYGTFNANNLAILAA